MWDPSLLYHEGRYHAFMMYNKDGADGLKAGYCILADSADGVHWQDVGIVNEEIKREGGYHFFKCFVGRCGDRFIMDHGVRRPDGQDTMRFYESTDLKTWNYLYSSQPDPRWYTMRRWDHMYILPKEENNPQAGYWGHPVAQALDESPRAIGLKQSTDGRSWEVLPPAKVDWGDTKPRDLEWGGCERFGGRYYLMGGTANYMDNKGYSMFVFSADDPCGPFRPERGAYRLCGTSHNTVSWLAAWCRGNGELLISNYASLESAEDRSPWMLPLRKPVVDKDGHLHMGWWPQNEKLKGDVLQLKTNVFTCDGSENKYRVTWLDADFDISKGLFLEGGITAAAAESAGANGSAGILLSGDGSVSTAIQLGIGSRDTRESHVGSLGQGAGGELEFVSDDVTGGDCATVNGIEDGVNHFFRLIVFRGVFELYINDLLMQTYRYQHGCSQIGFLARQSKVTVGNLKAFSLSL